MNLCVFYQPRGSRQDFLLFSDGGSAREAAGRSAQDLERGAGGEAHCAHTMLEAIFLSLS